MNQLSYEEQILSIFTFFGALILYILNRAQNKQPFSLFRAININVSDSARPINVIFDMLLSSIIGCIVVFPLVSPKTVPQAIIAGLGMTGILSAHTKDTGTNNG